MGMDEMVGPNVGFIQDSMQKSTVAVAGATTSYDSSSFLTNYPLMSSLLAFAIAQAIKVVTSW